MADEEAVAMLLDLHRQKKHAEVKLRLASVSKETAKAFKDRYRSMRHGANEPLSPRSSKQSSSSSSSSSSSRRTGKAVVLQAWEDEQAGLKLAEDDVVDLLSYASAEWCRVKFGRCKGAVPSSYLKLLPPALRSVVAIHDFKSDKPGHLPFARDDHLIVVDQLEGWQRGIKGSRFGRWPATYVRELSVEETEEQILLMGLQAEAAPDVPPPPRSRRQKSVASRLAASDSDSDDENRTLDTAIFRPDSSGGKDSDSDDDAAAAAPAAIKKTVSTPALATAKGAASVSVVPASKPPPPPSAPPGSLSVDAVAAAIAAAIDGGDVDAGVPAPVAALLNKLKERAAHAQRSADETHELAASLRAKEAQQEMQAAHQILRVKALEARSTQLDQREAALNARAAKLDEREHVVAAREEAVRTATSELRQRNNKGDAGGATAALTSAPEPKPEPEPEPAAEARGSLVPPPLPEDDDMDLEPPPLPSEPEAPTLSFVAAADDAGLSASPALPLARYLPMRDAQGWSVQPPLPSAYGEGRARAVHEAARTSLYGAARGGAAAADSAELRAASDAVLDALSANALDQLKDAALRFVAATADASRGRDDVLRASRCLVESIVNCLVFGEGGDASKMSYATSIANTNEMFERLGMMVGMSAATQERKLHVSQRAASARRESFVTAMRSLPADEQKDDEDDVGAQQSEFEACASTDVGRFFVSIIAKHGARFPAVQMELERKLPVLVRQAHVTTVEQLLGLSKEKLADLKFTQQLVVFVQQLGKKHIAAAAPFPSEATQR
jgi:hypothetical protein